MFLNSRGYRVLRFANWEALRERRRVLDAILEAAPPRLASPLTGLVTVPA